MSVPLFEKGALQGEWFEFFKFGGGTGKIGAA
jgi:hypothetical protein